MSTIHDFDSNASIDISFPLEKARAYKKEFNIIHKWDDLTIEEKKKIFIKAIADFKSGILSVDDLAEIAGSMWTTLPLDRSSDLAVAMYEACELSYYVRVMKKGQPNNFESFMWTVMEYYEKHKDD